MQAYCPRCGTALTAEAADCPVCAYGDAEEIVLLEAQRPGTAQAGPRRRPSALPRVLAAVAFLVVVIAVISALR